MNSQPARRLLKSLLALPQRQLSQTISGKAVRSEFGQDYTDDFLPDREAKEIEHQMRQEAQISLSRRPDDMLRHNADFSGILYKYDLPVENLPIVFRSNANLIAAEEAAEPTPTEALFEELECDKDTAFESFVIKMQQNYNNEVDMYGDIKAAGDCQLKVLEFGTPIPFETLEDEDSMTRIRSMFRVNTDIPGALELVHPNKFLPSKFSHQE